MEKHEGGPGRYGERWPDGGRGGEGPYEEGAYGEGAYGVEAYEVAYGVSYGAPYGESGPLFLHPDDDLAPNRPGEELHAMLAAFGPVGGPRTRLASAARRAGRLAGRPDPVAECREELAARQAVGEELESLTGFGWRVLHSLPLPGVAVLHHLLLGPGGVFAVHTVTRGWMRRHTTAQSPEGADRARLGRIRLEIPLRHARRAATTAELALTRATGHTTPVAPVLAVVGPDPLTVREPPDDVQIITPREAPDLGAHRAVLKPDTIARLYAEARDRRRWAGL
ncbi:nuclease-related domain-containing protein [Streptomyces sp. ODS28]|uniref:nuclease-related domain-containing protein n=1 Tax=Streptomyces sp. ODS28 TaxID=3136688 RepID=UPI0031F1637E